MTKRIKFMVYADVDDGVDPEGDKRFLEQSLEDMIDRDGLGPIAEVSYIEVYEESLSQAQGIIERWYAKEVADYAERLPQEFVDQLEDGHEEWNDFLHEELDGAGIVIYTYQARMILLASQNEDAYQEAFGAAPPSVSAAAFMALQADVNEAIGDIDDVLADLMPDDDDDDDEDED